MNWTQFLKAEVERTYSTTITLMEQVDLASLKWKPESGANWMTMGQLLRHLTDACGAGCRGFVTGEWGLPSGIKPEDMKPEQMLPAAEELPEVHSVHEAMRLLLKDEAVALRTIDEAGEEALANREAEAFWAPGVRLSLGHYMFRMIQHLDRHKSQLYYYLKLQGRPVNTLDLWGHEVTETQPFETTVSDQEKQSG